MKFKAIESILKESRTIIIYQGSAGKQWIGNGSCYYPIEDMELNTATICTIFDIPEDMRRKYSISEHTMSDFVDSRDCIDDEMPIEDGHILRIVLDGEIMMAFDIGGLAVYLPAKWFRPYKDEDITLYVRRNSAGQIYIAVKTGMFLAGMFAPPVTVTDDLLNRLERLTELSRNTWKAQMGSAE